jgi:hypothetical protein
MIEAFFPPAVTCAPTAGVRTFRWRAVVGLAVGALLPALVVAAATPAVSQTKGLSDKISPSPPAAIEIQAVPITSLSLMTPSQRKFGLLEFRGGLVLTSPAKEFGGISSIRVQPDGGRFIAATDRAWWLRGRITYKGDSPAGIIDAEMAPILGPDGRTLVARGWFDTEGMAQDGGVLYVSTERVNRVLRFDYGKDGLRARGQIVTVPPGVRTLPNNKGLEGLAFVPRGLPLGGALIALSERGLDKSGNHLAFLIGGPQPGTFTVKRSNAFDISDAALLPSGDLLVLERKFSWTSGLFIRLRRIALADVRPGALVDGPVLFEGDFSMTIDNMEGLSVHQSPTGERVLTMISDDNFSMIQRTLLLQFTLAGR